VRSLRHEVHQRLDDESHGFATQGVTLYGHITVMTARAVLHWAALSMYAT